jgi:hypothetical protein
MNLRDRLERIERALPAARPGFAVVRTDADWEALPERDRAARIDAHLGRPRRDTDVVVVIERVAGRPRPEAD